MEAYKSAAGLLDRQKRSQIGQLMAYTLLNLTVEMEAMAIWSKAVDSSYGEVNGGLLRRLGSGWLGHTRTGALLALAVKSKMMGMVGKAPNCPYSNSKGS